MQERKDKKYIDIILKSIRVCATYKPKMGQGKQEGISLEDFQRIYAEDHFYSWIGLDNPLMYTAHKAAGGMTSIYRQIGIGAENLIREIFKDELGLSAEQVKWSYNIIGANNKERKLSLDARISLKNIHQTDKHSKIKTWIKTACKEMNVDSGIAKQLQGILFEIRQGYKSKDSKRQNADIANAATAYTQAYLPCILVMSNQIDTDIVRRYRQEKWAILTGSPFDNSTLSSTYAFIRNVVGYDLESFFKRNTKTLRNETAKALNALLTP